MEDKTIRYASKIDEKDINFITNKYLKNPILIIFRLVAIVCGIYYILVGVRYLNYNHPEGKIPLCIGILFIIFATIFLKYVYKRKILKNSYIEEKRFIEITKDKISVEIQNSNINIKNEFQYNNFDSFYYIKDRIYIKLKNKQNYIILHEDGYLKGTSKDVINVLKENNITQKNS